MRTGLFLVAGFLLLAASLLLGRLLLEIQTGNLASIKSKPANLVHSHRIRLIYPIAQEKWIVQLAKDDRRALTRRKSPKRGRIEDLHWDMVSIPQLLSSRNLSLEVLMIREEEARRYEGSRKWRRRGWVIAESVAGSRRPEVVRRAGRLVSVSSEGTRAIHGERSCGSDRYQIGAGAGHLDAASVPEGLLVWNGVRKKLDMFCFVTDRG